MPPSSKRTPKPPVTAGSAGVDGARGRGRQAARVYAVEEVAELLGVSEAWVERALERKVDGFLPGAFRDIGDGEWRVPARALRHVLGEGLPRLIPVSEFAELVGLSLSWLYELMDLGVVPSRRVLGLRRIPATAYWQLPEHRPAAIPPRPDFFGDGKGDREE